MSVAYAADLNITCDGFDEGYCDNLKLDEEIDFELSDVDGDDKLAVCDESCDIVGESGVYNLNQLQTLIDRCDNNVLKLDHDYSGGPNIPFNSNSLKINKDLTIDGCGHTIDLKGTYVICSNHGRITLKNLKIVNGKTTFRFSAALQVTGDACYELDNCTLSGCSGFNGGAIYNGNNPLFIDKCSFLNNHASNGGAIYSLGEVNIVDSNFLDNTADAEGGAVYCQSDFLIFDSNFSSNNAATAGALKCLGKMTVFDSNFIDNNASADYSAIDCGGFLTLEESVVLNNFNNGYLWNQVHASKGKSVNPKVGGDIQYDDIYHLDLNKEVVNVYISNLKEFNYFFNINNFHKHSWKVLNITFAPFTDYIIGCNYHNSEFYSAYFNTDLVIINGNLGSVIHGPGCDFAYIEKNTKLIVNNMNFENFDKCFDNYGEVYCSDSNFNKNKQVMLNNDTSKFENCRFF